MNLKVVRYSSQNDSTLGLLYIDGEFECHTLEDEHRDEKVKHETRIPEGTYKIKLRTVGGFHTRYSKHKNEKIRSKHKGMLHVTNVPGFEYILIHCGNDDDDTSGCLLVGNTANNNKIKAGFIGDSQGAYSNMYPKVLEALEAGEDVTIEYICIG